MNYDQDSTREHPADEDEVTSSQARLLTAQPPASQGQTQRGLAPHPPTGSKIGYRQRSQALPEHTCSKEAEQLSPGLSYKKSRFQPRLCEGCTSPVCFPCAGAAGARASSQSRGNRRLMAKPALGSTKKSCRTEAPSPSILGHSTGCGMQQPRGFFIKKKGKFQEAPRSHRCGRASKPTGSSQQLQCCWQALRDHQAGQEDKSKTNPKSSLIWCARR